MSRPDVWLVRLRALTGLGALAWELVREQGSQWWVLIIAMWLLGAPLEELVRLLTGGRLQINVRRGRDEEDDER